MSVATSKRPVSSGSGSRSAAQRKRIILNVPLLIWTFATLAIGFGALYFWYQRQHAQLTQVLLQRADEEAKQENWSKSANYLRQYIAVEPNDVDALASLADRLSKDAKTGDQITRVNAVLYRVLGQRPEDHELRLDLAKNLLTLGDYGAARTEASTLRTKATKLTPVPAFAADSQRIFAICELALARQSNAAELRSAWKEIQEALRVSPNNVQLVEVACGLLRSNWEKLGLPSDEAAKLADAAMDAMVQADPSNADALLSRYRYKSAYGHDDAVVDLDAALRLRPDDYQSLLLKSVYLTRKEPSAEESAESEELARKAIEIDGEQAAAYLTIARHFEKQGKFRQAADEVKRGLQAVSQDRFALALALPGLLVRASALDEADLALKELRKQSGEYLAGLTSVSRRQVERQISLAEAHVALAHGAAPEVIDELQSLQQELRSRNESATSPEAFQTTQLLAGALAASSRWYAAGRCYQELGDMIQKAGSTQTSSAEIKKLEAESRLAAARMLLKAGQYDAAIVNLTRHVELMGPTTSAATELATAHLQRQLKRPPAERQWQDFQTQLRLAKELGAAANARPELALVLVEVEFLLNSAPPKSGSESSDAAEQALALLQKSEDEFREEVAFWRGAAVAYQRIGDATALARAVENFERVEESFSQRALFGAMILAQGGKVEEADKRLTEGIREAPAAEKLELELYRIKFLIATRQLEVARSAVDELIPRQPKNLQALQLAAELALLQSQWTIAADLERRLAELLGRDHFDVEMVRARRLVGDFAHLTALERDDLSRLLAKMRAARPTYYPVIALAARVAALSNDDKQALDDYRSAIGLGDDGIESLQAYVDLLAKCGEFDEAQRQLAKLETMRPSDDQVESFAIGLALQLNQIPEALERAREAVAADPNDPARRVWLANVLIRAGQKDAADAEFEQIARDFPKDSRALGAWFTYLVDSGQPDKARDALQRLADQSDLTGAQRSFVLGQCHEKLGELDVARQSFQTAIDASPKNVSYRLRLSSLLLSTDVTAARKELDTVLTLEPSNLEARRQLATLLAASGTEDDWSRIGELLRDTGGNSRAEDERLRALLLVQKGQSRSERVKNSLEAAKVITALIDRPDNTRADLDRLILAGIYEQEAARANRPSAYSDARRALLPIVERAKVTPEMLRLYVQFILRALASDTIKGLTQEDRDKITRLFLSDAQARVKQLRLVVDGSPEGAFENLAVETAVLAAAGEKQQAAALLKQFDQEQSDQFVTDSQKAKFHLQIGNLYSTLQQYPDAQAAYRQLMTIAPGAFVILAESLAAEGKLEDAIEVFFKAAETEKSANLGAALAKFLAATKYSGPRLAEADALLAGILAAHVENAPFLLAMGVLAVERGQADRAIDFFRRVAKVEPQNALALNNLATLLGESPQHRNEAIECIDRAIAVEGRKAPLLDTRGTIYLLAGDYVKAIQSLEEAVAGGSFDPRYDFHLAVAYQKANRTEDARRTIRYAEDKGLGAAMLTANDEQLLEELSQALQPTSRN